MDSPGDLYILFSGRVTYVEKRVENILEDKYHDPLKGIILTFDYRH
jgi:hypothetical protein